LVPGCAGLEPGAARFFAKEQLKMKTDNWID
jgi:hypothetical protein